MDAGATAIEHPNRDTDAARTTRAAVVVLLLASALLMTIVTAGGWTRLQGAKPVQIAYIVLYLVLAVQVARWRSGLLPVAAALAIMLALFAAISAPLWFDRDRPGLADPALDSALLGTLTILIAALQIGLVALSARGFSQRWSVEVRAASSRPRPPRSA